MTVEEWQALIEAQETPIVSLRAETYLKSWRSASSPVLVTANDRAKYVLKGGMSPDQRRQAFNDQVVGRLGMLLQAPVGEVFLMMVPPELIVGQAEMGHLATGPVHASRFVENCTERAGIAHATLAENEERFASLAVLYGWMHAQDHQFLYSLVPPPIVYSVDHGHFFHIGPSWTPDTLRLAPEAQCDQTIVRACAVGPDALRGPLQQLAEVTDEEIAQILSVPPPDWGVGGLEKAHLGQYLSSRRDVLTQALHTEGEEEE